MSSVFDRIPSAQDLLSRPVLRRLTQTLDRQIVVGRVRQYLSELRTQWEQATGEGTLPSVAGLAERIARWIAEREQLGPRLVINATGNLFHGELSHAPMAEAACSAMSSSAFGGVYSASGEAAAAHGLPAGTERRLKLLLGAEAVCVVNSLSAAVSLLFSAWLSQQRVLVCRGDVIEFANGMRLSDLAQRHHVELAEIGASNLVRIDDFERALQADAAAWLRIGAGAVGEAGARVEISHVRDRANRELAVVEVLTQAAAIDWAPFGLPNVPVVGQRLAAGVDLVVFPGDRWLAGPAVGIIAGRQSLIDPLRQSPDRFAVQVDSIRAAGLDAAVRIYDDSQSAAEKHPQLMLLAATPENLSSRATRIAPQLAALAGVADAHVVETEVEQSVAAGQPVKVPTFRVRVTPNTMPVAEARRQLATHPQFSVLPVERDDELLFDLRSVHPRYDAELVARISEVFMNETEA